jgi:DNA-binding NarL/FixJ family response regulator
MSVQEPEFAATASKKRVLLVDDHPVVRQGLADVLNAQPDLAVCGEAGDAATALALADSLSPDVAVVDLTLGATDGLDVVKPLKRGRRSVPSVVFSMGDERRYAERALRAGARGYVMKSEPPATVLAAVRRVLGGAVFVSEAVAARLLSKIADGDGDGDAETGAADVDAVARLSQREYEVFRLIGQGAGPTEVAQRLGVSVKTVETYRENIKSKLKLPGGRELLRQAMRHVEAP